MRTPEERKIRKNNGSQRWQRSSKNQLPLFFNSSLQKENDDEENWKDLRFVRLNTSFYHSISYVVLCSWITTHPWEICSSLFSEII